MHPLYIPHAQHYHAPTCNHVPTTLPSQVDGNLITWQKWSIRMGFNYREGLVLHDVRYVYYILLCCLFLCNRFD